MLPRLPTTRKYKALMSYLTPLLSIAIPTYEMKGQGVVFLARCLASIDKQVEVDLKQIEVVVSDQSRDHAIASFCQENAGQCDFHLRYERTLTGRGIAAHNLNTAIKTAQGKYIKILFQDDLLVENHYLATIVKTIADNRPQCILTGATHTTDGIHFYNPITPTNNPYLLFGNNTISSPSVLTVAKDVFNHLTFDEHLKLLFDCDFYYQLFESCQVIDINDHIHIANGVWDGQTQFAISAKQFTGEVRYLNWKYPNAQLIQLLPSYQQYFKELHPGADFPFDANITPNRLQQYWWSLAAR